MQANFRKNRKKLPGIGVYTAGAIASIAYGRLTPAVDGNVLRVIARVTASRLNVSDAPVKRDIERSLKEVYPTGRASDFTQALMELGAMICLPNGVPKCEVCPLQTLCLAHAQEIQEELPVKTAKKQRTIEQRTVFLIVCEEKAAIRQRPAKGLLARLWEFPSVIGTLSPQQAEELLKSWGLSPLTIEPLPKAKHIFTHIEWQMCGFLVTVGAETSDGGLKWASHDEFVETYPLPTAFKSFLRRYYTICP
jgi:A/G-specific adenine glycosylase